LLDGQYFEGTTSVKNRSAVRVLQWNSLQRNDGAGQWPGASQSYVTRSMISLSHSVERSHEISAHRDWARRFTGDFMFTFQSTELISL
jgi:hypothetical protein